LPVSIKADNVKEQLVVQFPEIYTPAGWPSESATE
jgi:hypothetical protein